MSATGIGIYFWGTYIWFVIGFLLIGGPAIVEIVKMNKKK